MMKTPNKILPRRKVHTRLAADRRVHLRQQRRWNLHVPDAAQVDRRQKSRHVAHHAAAEGNQWTVAIGSCLGHLLGQRLHRAHPLVLLTRGNKEHRWLLVCFERGKHALAPQSPYSRRGYDEGAKRPPSLQPLQPRGKRPQQSRSNRNVVAGTWRLELNHRHNTFILSLSSSREFARTDSIRNQEPLWNQQDRPSSTPPPIRQTSRLIFSSSAPESPASARSRVSPAKALSSSSPRKNSPNPTPPTHRAESPSLWAETRT